MKDDPSVRVHHLVRETLRAFYWLDTSLQNLLAEHGWPRTSHAQSMVVLALGEGIQRQTDIARRLGISRQAVHQMLTIMAERGLVEAEPDPEDGRNKIFRFSESATKIRLEASQIVTQLETVLRKRLGESLFTALVESLGRDWGAPIESSADLVD